MRGITMLICAVCSLCLPLAAFADDGSFAGRSLESGGDLSAVVSTVGDNATIDDASDDLADDSAAAYGQEDGVDAGDSSADPEADSAASDSVASDEPEVPVVVDDPANPDDSADPSESADQADSDIEKVPAFPGNSHASATDTVGGGFSDEEIGAVYPKELALPAGARGNAGSRPNEIASAHKTASATNGLSSLEESAPKTAAHGKALSNDDEVFEENEGNAETLDVGQGEFEKADSFAKAESKREPSKTVQPDLEEASDVQLTTSHQQAFSSSDAVAALFGCADAESAGCATQADPMENTQLVEEPAPVMATPAHHGRVGFAFPGTSDRLPCVPPELEVSVRLAQAFSQGEFSLLVPDEGSSVCSLRAARFQGRDDEGKPTCRRGCMRCRSPSHSLFQ